MRLNRRQTLSGGIATLICFVLPDIAARPEVGRLTGRGNTANLKLIVQLKPDLIVDVGSMTDTIHFARRSRAESNRQLTVRDRTAHRSLFARPSRSDYEIAHSAIERLGITHLAGRPYTRISGGERQLALIARTLAQQAQIILLDEPTGDGRIRAFLPR